MLQVSRARAGGRGDGEKEIDRWKKRARARGWSREFEESVKGFDCNGGKRVVAGVGGGGARGDKMKQKWHKMTQNGR